MIFKRIIAILFAGLILVNSNGLIVNTHSCIAKICAENHCGSISTFFKESNCCEKSKENTKTSNNCCSSESKIIKATYSDLLENQKRSNQHDKSFLTASYSDVHFLTHFVFVKSGDYQYSIKKAFFFSPTSAKQKMRFLQTWRC